jgi:hypothetical protein
MFHSLSIQLKQLLHMLPVFKINVAMEMVRTQIDLQ